MCQCVIEAIAQWSDLVAQWSDLVAQQSDYIILIALNSAMGLQLSNPVHIFLPI